VLNLVKSLARGRSRGPAIPAGERVYAVGDIHGRSDLLEDLIGRIDADDAARPRSDTTIIFLGDLVDRGPDSKGVVACLLALRRERGERVRFLRGNHEEVFLRAAAGEPRLTRYLVRIGGRPTLHSYGVTDEEYETLQYEALAARFAALVPEEHRVFLGSFEDMIAVGDYLFVHAGLRPGVPIEAQDPEDLYWIREEFLDHRETFGRMVVHGHSISEEVEIRSNRIGIDTGAYASGRLTAIGLEGEERWFLST
jgi:serine/threonine protein phosphatase 1